MVNNSEFVQVVSADEALLDVTKLTPDPQDHSASSMHAEKIRAQIFSKTGCLSKTGCRASVGIGFNPLTARLATFRAKPNGVSIISAGNLHQILFDLPVSKLPGVGWQTVKRCNEMELETCGPVQHLDLEGIT